MQHTEPQVEVTGAEAPPAERHTVSRRVPARAWWLVPIAAVSLFLVGLAGDTTDGTARDTELSTPRLEVPPENEGGRRSTVERGELVGPALGIDQTAMIPGWVIDVDVLADGSYVAVVADDQGGWEQAVVVRSRDLVTWEEVPLPGSDLVAKAVTAYGDGMAVLGYRRDDAAGPLGVPVGETAVWTSGDGSEWRSWPITEDGSSLLLPQQVAAMGETLVVTGWTQRRVEASFDLPPVVEELLELGSFELEPVPDPQPRIIVHLGGDEVWSASADELGITPEQFTELVGGGSSRPVTLMSDEPTAWQSVELEQGHQPAGLVTEIDDQSIAMTLWTENNMVIRTLGSDLEWTDEISVGEGWGEVARWRGDWVSVMPGSVALLDRGLWRPFSPLGATPSPGRSAVWDFAAVSAHGEWLAAAAIGRQWSMFERDPVEIESEEGHRVEVDAAAWAIRVIDGATELTRIELWSYQTDGLSLDADTGLLSISDGERIVARVNAIELAEVFRQVMSPPAVSGSVEGRVLVTTDGRRWHMGVISEMSGFWHQPRLMVDETRVVLFMVSSGDASSEAVTRVFATDLP